MVAICGLDGVRIRLKLGLRSKFNHVQTSNFKNFETFQELGALDEEWRLVRPEGLFPRHCSSLDRALQRVLE